MIILAFESTCDETAVALVENGRRVLADAILSQADMHALYGGVVPEIASRKHVEAIAGLTDRALQDAGLTKKDVDAVAVSYAPGLIGAVLVGVSFAKSVAYALGVPLIPVHHIRGHIAANYLAFPELQPPFLALAISGGNTLLVDVKDYTDMEILGSTRDDAAGECFDKAARVLGLPYPGGKPMDELAQQSQGGKYDLPRAHVSGCELDMSFSGLKTAVVNLAHNARQKGEDLDAAALARDFTRAVSDELVPRAVAAAKGLAPFAAHLESLPAVPSADAAGRLFDSAHAARMLDEALAAEPALAQFNGLDHSERIKRFRELDDRFANLSREAAFAKISEKLPLDMSAKVAKKSELGILRHECEKKMRHKPIRQLLAEIPTLAPALKPCFLMSPLSVAQYLPPDTDPFDLIVFDEASQIPVWDAIGVIARGKQLIVVGDPKQMPPTSFFQKADTEGEDDDEAAQEDMESILDECLAAGVFSSHLNWHYRSRHESLIAFSNHNYYDDRLYTFPAANRSPSLGVRFQFVADGIYDRKASRTNEKEARALVDWVFDHVKAPGYKPRSVGVVTFSEAQKDLIEGLFEERREKDPSIESFFSDENPEPFFVKNLENVQGDERDVILFSVGYAADKDGKLAMNFGPLNRTGGERRLNVAVTRAKEQVVVFASIHGSQIDLSRTSAVGAAHLKSFLEFAEKGSDAAPQAAAKDNGAFPKAVAEFLRGKGYEVDECVGTGACRIDLAVKKPGADDYLLAIECDGPSYASQLTVRDRDQLRPSVLKSLGWKLTRLWSVDWALDRTRAENALLALLDSLK